MKTLAITFDDFYHGSDFNGLALVEELVRQVPDIKLTLFTIPKYREPMHCNYSWVQDVSRLIWRGNIELGVHGYEHTSGEFGKVKMQEASLMLKLAEQEFNRAMLRFKKIFKAPNCVINDATRHALAEMGYTHVFVNEHTIHETILEPKQVMYTWNIKHKPDDRDHHITYGHINDVCGNGLKQRMAALVDEIKKHRPIFRFGSEL